MEIKLTLALPRDGLSVPVVRRVLRGAMETLGVAEEVITAIEVALTEACTNVLDHAEDSDQYEVSAGIDGDLCVIEVVDREPIAFDGDDKGLSDAADGAEEGRGIQLMRALVDKVEFTSRPHAGTVVHLEKALVWTRDAPGRRLSAAMAPTDEGPWAHGDEDDGAHDDGAPAA